MSFNILCIYFLQIHEISLNRDYERNRDFMYPTKSKTGFLHLLCNIYGVNSLHKKKIQNPYVRKHRNGSAIYLVHYKSFDCTVGYMMHQVLLEFINLFFGEPLFYQ